MRPSKNEVFDIGVPHINAFVGGLGPIVLHNTGGNIVWGLRCAEIAAKAIEYAFDANRYGAFFWKTEYERRRQAAIGKDLKRQLAVRNLYGRLSNEQISKIFEIIKPSLKHMGAFDCDALSGLVKKLPKFSVARTIVPALLRLS